MIILKISSVYIVYLIRFAQPNISITIGCGYMARLIQNKPWNKNNVCQYANTKNRSQNHMFHISFLLDNKEI